MRFNREAYIHQPAATEKELKVLFNQQDPLTIFDIGACEGEDSVRYARLFPKAKIFSFEPLPQNIALIAGNLKKYNVKNVSFFNTALAAEIGTAEFYVSEGRPQHTEALDWDYGNKSSSLLPPDKHVELIDFIQFNKKITVETTTLDAFCGAHQVSAIDFIHMDVQGAEMMVLRGAGKVLPSIKAIWLEVSKVSLYKDQPLENDIIIFMESNGFVLLKSTVDDISGDHFYINRRYYPNHTFIHLKLKLASLLKRA